MEMELCYLEIELGGCGNEVVALLMQSDHYTEAPHML